MNLSTCCRLAVCLLLLTFLSGCGSSSENDTAPSTIETFNFHSAVFDNNSTMYVAGYNAFGQLGNGNFERSTEFKTVAGLGLEKVAGFAVGGAHTLAFQNNSSVRAWGSNQYGQVGSNADTGSRAASKRPIKIMTDASTGLGGVTAVAAGAYHSLALTAGGEVYAWGNNRYGQLGNGTTSDDPQVFARKVQKGEGIPLDNIKAIAAGGLFSLALDNNGNLWGWGRNEYGELARQPLKDTVTRAVQLTTAQDIDAIAAAGSYGVALKKNGEVWAWGLNNWGQLARDPFGSEGKEFSEVPEKVALPATVTKVAAGTNHVLALDVNGNVWGWGLNYYGQLGNNNRAATSRPESNNKVRYLSSTPLQVVTSDTPGAGGLPLGGVSDVFAFGHSSFARSAAGLYSWGANVYGQLGFEDLRDLGYQENLHLDHTFYQRLPL